MPFGEQRRHPLVHVVVQLGEAAGRVTVAKILTPSPKELVYLVHQQAGRAMTATAPGVIPYPRPGTVHCCWLSSSAPPYMVAMPCSIMEIGSGNGPKPAP